MNNIRIYHTDRADELYQVDFVQTTKQYEYSISVTYNEDTDEIRLVRDMDDPALYVLRGPVGEAADSDDAEALYVDATVSADLLECALSSMRDIPELIRHPIGRIVELQRA